MTSISHYVIYLSCFVHLLKPYNGYFGLYSTALYITLLPSQFITHKFGLFA